MPLNITGNVDQELTWTNFKAIAITSKNLPIQYFNDGSTYTIWAFDGPCAYACTIWQGTVPDSVIASGYSQAQNNTDQTDFTTNYQSGANKTTNGTQTVQSTAAWTTSTASNTALTVTVTGYGTTAITLNQGSTITGGVVTFEVSDTAAGTNWYPISVISTAGATVPSSTYTLQQSVNASFQTNVAGYVQFRVRLSTVISGTGTVNVGVISNPTSAEWQQAVYITDASHGPVAVKAASTAAVAADPSLVTAFSPNSPLPAGSNVIGALTANQSVNLAQVAGATTSTSASGVQKVGVVGGAGTSLETTAGVLDHNLKNVGNAAVTTLAAGEQKVAVEGLAASGAALSGNPVLVGGSDGVDARSISTDTSGRQIVVGAAASGVAVAGNPIYIGGQDPNGHMIGAVSGGEGSIGVNHRTNLFVVQANATVTSSGSTIATNSNYGVQQISLVVNVKAAPTGTTPTITYTIQEVDPGDDTTVMGNSASTSVISGVGVYTATLSQTTSGTVQVSWTITGSSASFTQVYATIVCKATPSTQTTSTTSTIATPGIGLGYITTTSKTNVPLQSATYNEQSANFTGSIVSSSASDAAAGTGARTVTIYWMNAAGTSIGTETATLNGTTAVNLVTTTKCFIEKVVVNTVGSGGSNVGNITLFSGATGGGTAVCVIVAGDNRTFMCHHYVLSGKTCHVTDFTGTTNSSNQTLFSIQAANIPTANQVSIQISDWLNGSQTFQVQRTFSSGVSVVGPARLQLFVAPGSTASIISYGSFTFYDQ